MIECRGSKCLSEPKSSQTRTILNEAKYLLKNLLLSHAFHKNNNVTYGFGKHVRVLKIVHGMDLMMCTVWK